MGFSKEPIVYIAIVTAAVHLAILFGLHLTTAQQAGIDSLLAAIAAIWGRSQVTPS